MCNAENLRSLRIAFVIPCYNEALAIEQVIAECRAALPEAQIHVMDNNSSDGTADVARAAGAQVTHVRLQGKGNVVRRMFADVDADIYVMTDGDATYDMSTTREMVELLISENLDMIVGTRVDDGLDSQTYRRGHRLGNQLLTQTVTRLFGGSFSDMLSGYRVFSRRYVKSFPAAAKGFEIETELTVHALELRMPHAERPLAYRSRPEGSQSKLSTYRDGWRILRAISKLYVSERPMSFFTLVALVFLLASIGLAVPVIDTWLRTGLVPRFPTALLSVGLSLSAMLSFVCGVVLHTVTMGRQEAKRLRYLSEPGVRPTWDALASRGL